METDLAAWASISAAVLPFVAGIVIQQHWDTRIKAIMVAVLATTDAVVVQGLTHGWHLDEHTVVTIAAVFAVARTTYSGLWKPALGIGGGPGLSPFSERGVDPARAALAGTGYAETHNAATSTSGSARIVHRSDDPSA